MAFLNNIKGKFDEGISKIPFNLDSLQEEEADNTNTDDVSTILDAKKPGGDGGSSHEQDKQTEPSPPVALQNGQKLSEEENIELSKNECEVLAHEILGGGDSETGPNKCLAEEPEKTQTALADPLEYSMTASEDGLRGVNLIGNKKFSGRESLDGFGSATTLSKDELQFWGMGNDSMTGEKPAMQKDSQCEQVQVPNSKKLEDTPPKTTYQLGEISDDDDDDDGALGRFAHRR